MAVAFALLSTMDFDPFKKHTRPKTLNFISTFPQYRRQGYAFKLLEHIKERCQFMAVCSNDQSVNLFVKSKCNAHGNDTFTYP